MRYEQIDIRRLDEHMSTDLARLVLGHYYFNGMDSHRMRVYRLQTIIMLQKMVMQLGDFEHTGDWDWRISVTHAPENEMATDPKGTNYERDVWSDTMELDYEVEPTDYTTDFSRWTHLTVTEFHFTTDEPSLVLVPIDDIRVIHIDYD